MPKRRKGVRGRPEKQAKPLQLHSTSPPLQPFKPKQRWIQRQMEEAENNKDISEIDRVLGNDIPLCSGAPTTRKGPSVIKHTSTRISALVSHFSPATQVDTKKWRKAITAASLAYHETLSEKANFGMDTLDGTETIEDVEVNRKLMMLFTSRWSVLRKQFFPKQDSGKN